jgi:hypothetical protein
MTKALLSFFLKLLFFSLILLGIHYYIFFHFFSEIILYFPLWSIYAFNAVLVLIVYGVIYYQVTRGSRKSYQLFLILTLVKMVLAIVFLLPLFAGKSDNSVIEVVNFFIPYFMFLTFEIFSLNKFFTNQETK